MRCVRSCEFFRGRIGEVNLFFSRVFLFKILGSGIMYTCNTSQYNEKKGFASSISNENDHVYSKTHVGFVQILN